MTPILKWAGGKSWYVPNMPRTAYERVIDPFCGGLALPLACGARNTIISDANPWLIEVYRAIQADPMRVFFDLCKLPDDSQDWRGQYYEIRDRFNVSHEPADFIWLNRSCFNGLYRVNSFGQYNVPCGNYKNRGLPTVDDLIQLSVGMAGWDISRKPVSGYRGFEFRPGDLLILDPPYDDGCFDSYMPGKFDELAAVAALGAAAVVAGAHVVAFNFDTAHVRRTYGKLGPNVGFTTYARKFSNGAKGSVSKTELVAWVR